MENIYESFESEGIEEDVDICLFAKLVECRPWLHVMENSKYKNKNFKDETWRLDAEAMRWKDDECEMTAVIECRTTWKRLRDNFIRACKKLLSGAGGADYDVFAENKKKHWKVSFHGTSSNIKWSENQITKFKLSLPLRPKEQWSDRIIIEKNPIQHTEEIGGSEHLETNEDGNGETVKAKTGLYLAADGFRVGLDCASKQPPAGYQDAKCIFDAPTCS
ncbi:hypothetical protein JTB14_013599 [Gonioctena quinquepunctata]|nr:hypothetical protein JTB14_013599 [Gonioctena quinquepunctata]